MRIAINAAIDRRLERVVVTRARRRSPVLHLVPARWIGVAARPTIVRVRRGLLLAAAGGAEMTLVLVAVLNAA